MDNKKEAPETLLQDEYTVEGKRIKEAEDCYVSKYMKKFGEEYEEVRAQAEWKDKLLEQLCLLQIDELKELIMRRQDVVRVELVSVKDMVKQAKDIEWRVNNIIFEGGK